jgi:competence protein ComEC
MLAQVAILFLFGLCLGALLPYLPCTILSVALLAAVGLTILERRQALTPARGLLLYLSLLAGAAWWTLDDRSHLHGAAVGREESGSGRLTGRIVEPVRHAPNRMLLVLDSPGASPGRVRVSWRQPDRSFYQGEQVELVARIRPPTGLLNPGGFDHAAYLVHRGIRGVASATGPG